MGESGGSVFFFFREMVKKKKKEKQKFHFFLCLDRSIDWRLLSYKLTPAPLAAASSSSEALSLRERAL